MTALLHACWHGRLAVVRLLFEVGADSTIATPWGETTLVGASFGGHLEIVRLLLAHPSAKATINRRDMIGTTAYVGGLLPRPWGGGEGAAGGRGGSHDRQE
jgi:hypothetical protein